MTADNSKVLEICYLANRFVKKTASILLLVLLSFNWIGYRFLTGWLEHRADATLQSRIAHSDFDENKLVAITVPLNTPYMSGASTAFEPYDGEIDLNGVHYHYVKRRVLDGNLVLLCLPNESKDKIRHSRAEFFKLVNDLGTPNQGKEKNSSAVKSFAPEYSPEGNCWSVRPPEVVAVTGFVPETNYPASAFHQVVKQPPRA